jgi:anti-anti-sigma factor
MNLHVSRNGSLAILLAEGRIGWDSSRLMDTRVRTLVQDDVKHIVFQLEVDFLSSGAIGVLVYYLRNLQKSKGDIYLVASKPYVKELLQAIGFLKVFEGKVFDDYASMQAGLKERGIEVPDASSLNYMTVESTFDTDD